MEAASPAAEPSSLEVLPWLKSMSSAPEYHPTLAEFQDPIAYILKIEKEASSYGICKIVPPLSAAPKKTVMSNFNRSFAARDPNPKKPPTFTTRQQQIGFSPRRPRPVQKPVWQSGEQYTLQQFESKAKQFEKTLLRKYGKKAFSPLEIETLFWKACADKPFSVEYANDMPGSGFAPIGGGRTKWCLEEDAANVGETAWNMRGVSRARWSLLRFMKDEIPGVTSPMVYVAMMFSWFAWHVEDHEFHSLNYLHTGAGKTWYGVPRDARHAFEDVIRNQGYGGEVNPLVTFTTLGEKTTIMSPEIISSLGIPCCRLVQNAGEFVVTFPGSYHTGFSHGFNCGEAANIATPEWLRVAKEAAVRRASTNFPPMVSHFQLLYDLALSLCSRMQTVSSTEPRSSRLKDKMKGEGESMIKSIFVQSVAQNNDLLDVLLKSSSCIILPRKASETLNSGLLTQSQIKVDPSLSHSLRSSHKTSEASEAALSDEIMPGRNPFPENLSGPSLKGNSLSMRRGNRLDFTRCSRHETTDFCSSASESQNLQGEKQRSLSGDMGLDQRLLSCVTCGILSFACVAVVQPTKEAARLLMSADFSFFSDHNMGYGEISNTDDGKIKKTGNHDLFSCSGPMKVHFHDRVDDSLVPSAYTVHTSEQRAKDVTEMSASGNTSALDILASAYGYLSDSEDEDLHNMSSCKGAKDCDPSSRVIYSDELRDQNSAFDGSANSGGMENVSSEENHVPTLEDSKWNRLESLSTHTIAQELDDGCLTKEVNELCIDDSKMGRRLSGLAGSIDHNSPGYAPFSPIEDCPLVKHLQDCGTKKSVHAQVMPNSDKDSSRMHVFCLEHALEVSKKLHSIGGVNIMLLCHPHYPKTEAEAKTMAEELGIDHDWKDISFREATKDDQERIQLALEDEEAVPTNSDWAVKFGINLYYSANLSKSPIYSKQLPHNAVIYKAFGCNSPGNSPVKPKGSGRRPGKQKKLVVAGKWCGKVWMSNQVHPYLLHRLESQENECAEKISFESSDQKHLDESDTEQPEEPIRAKRNLVDNPQSRKLRKKRKKMPPMNTETKKPRHIKPEDISEEDAAGKPSSQLGKIGNQLKQSTPQLRCKIHNMVKSNMDAEDQGGPSTRLRRRIQKTVTTETKTKTGNQGMKKKKKAKMAPDQGVLPKKDERIQSSKKSKKGRATNVGSGIDGDHEFPCDVEGCSMSFDVKSDLVLHKKNICPVKGCGKKFFSHKYLVQHRKVHLDDRPLKCPWKGCKMAFKWAWARTEHIRVHTGDRPYICREPGCDQTFRFVSDFSRHKRKTGHSAKKVRR